MKKFAFAVLFFVALSSVCFASMVHKYFGSVDEMVKYIEKLDEYQYSTLKIFVLPSTRNTFGIMGEPYNIIYKSSK